MSLHHPPLLTFEEAMGAGARLHLRQQDALRRAADATELEVEKAAEVIDAYLRRMSETEIRRGPRRTGPDVPAGQTTVHDHLRAADADDDDDHDRKDPLAA